MMGRRASLYGTLATTTACPSRASASVSPTWAYSGSVKLPTGLAWSPVANVGPSTALVAAAYPSYIACGEDVRSGRAQMGVDCHVAARCHTHARRCQIQRGGVRLPTDGHHRDTGFSSLGTLAVRVDHTHAGT